tara:strand:+ start:1355 stop:2023 length:669 start_codon:yes stop_codon:yes gene_type:complete
MPKEKPPTIRESIGLLHELCCKRFDVLEQKLAHIDDRCGKIEQELGALRETGVGGVGGGGGAMNFMNIENKIDHLNQNVKPLSSPLNEHLQTHLQVCNEDVYSILGQKYTMYQFVSRCMCDHVDLFKTEQGICVLYAFPFQKNTIYMWNHDKQSWDKMNQVTMKSIFELVQRKLIALYNSLRLQNDEGLLAFDLIECGMYLYEDGFEKKYNDFKKMIFQGLC